MSLSEFFWKALRRALHATGIVRVVLLSEKGRLTMYVERLEEHVRAKGWRARYKWLPPWIIAFDPAGTPNESLRTYFRAFIILVDSKEFWCISWLVKRLAFGPAEWDRRFSRRLGRDWDEIWEKPSSLSVCRQQSIRDTLESVHGISDFEKRLVLLSVRDSEYYAALRRSGASVDEQPEISGDADVRNPNVDSYLPACQMLRERGYNVVRVGVNQTPLGPDWNGVARDVSRLSGSSALDLQLASRCAFFLNGASGFWALTSLFNRPHLSLNTYSFFKGTGVSSRDIFAPQLLRRVCDGSLLSFAQMAELGTAASTKSSLQERGLSLVKLSVTEITETVLEMIDRLSGSFEESPSDILRRRRFEEIRVRSSGRHERGQISSLFLRRHESLLET
jgi:putative glycosyltransferase (TIGR04372 family)